MAPAIIHQKAFLSPPRLTGIESTIYLKLRDSTIWVATHRGILKYQDGQTENFTTSHGLIHDTVTDICQKEDGTLWFATSGGISSFDGRHFNNFTEAHGLSFDRVNALECKDYKTIWAGTDNGMSRLDYSTVTYGKADGLIKPDNQLTGIFDLSGTGSDSLLLATGWRGLFLFDGKKITPIDGLNGELYIRKILPLRSNDYLLGTHMGLTRFTPQSENTEIFFHKNEEWTLTVERNPDGTIWTGRGWAGGGLFKYDAETGERLDQLQQADGLPNEQVWALMHAEQEGLWIGTGTGIVLMKAGVFP